MQSCIEGANAGTWEWNVQTGETRFNARWAEIVGYSLEEFGPVPIQTWLDLAHPEDLEASQKALNDHWSGKPPFYDITARMGPMARIGGWDVELAKNEVTWTAETRRIHGMPDNYAPTFAEEISFYAPEAPEDISQAVERAMADETRRQQWWRRHIEL